MEKPTKILLIGLAASVLIFGAGYFVSSRAEAKRAELVLTCKSAAPVSGQAKGMFDDMICSPADVDLMREQRNFAEKSLILSASIAFFVFVLCVMPYSWYFMLRRIRELRDALFR